MTQQEAHEKLRQYCIYQDRCHQEVRTKLLSLKIYGDWLEEIMSDLINEGYLNEERFARNYARGKYRIKGFGKVRITKDLKLRKVSDYCIRKALEEVDEEGGYEETIEKHINKFISQRLDKYPEPVLRKKALSHGVAKGFEMPLVLYTIDSVFKKIK